ncbi:uncharacterized protein LOC121390258 [Gigantopelta aegis]|uniref:uncharacterized protein LOC121390258 n=1 Tax=Gigantopelta aegis TaxID=1735272 RepID=UPI001B88DD98|nr:uncharacterized protein LOC121390258 [Gigantopelta aegis]
MSEPTSEEVRQLVSAFQKLKTWPKADSAEELVEWMSSYVQSADTSGSSKADFPTSITLNQPPKLPFFSGDSKCETTFDVWKHQYNCLLKNESLSRRVLFRVAQQSLRGKAATVAMSVGPDGDVNELVAKLEDMFGSVVRGQSLLSEFYRARQTEDEDVTSWACRLEEILNRASAHDGLTPTSRDELLHNQLWSGLRADLRDKSAYLFDQGGSFGNLLRSLRRMEADMSERQPTKKTISKAATSTETSELQEMKGMIKQLSADVAKLKNSLLVTMLNLRHSSSHIDTGDNSSHNSHNRARLSSKDSVNHQEVNQFVSVVDNQDT